MVHLDSPEVNYLMTQCLLEQSLCPGVTKSDYVGRTYVKMPSISLPHKTVWYRRRSFRRIPPNVHHGMEINRSSSLKTIPIHYHDFTETNNRYPGTLVSIWNKHSTVAITRTDCCEIVRIRYLNEIRSKSFTRLSSWSIPSFTETFLQ